MPSFSWLFVWSGFSWTHKASQKVSRWGSSLQFHSILLLQEAPSCPVSLHQCLLHLGPQKVCLGDMPSYGRLQEPLNAFLPLSVCIPREHVGDSPLHAPVDNHRQHLNYACWFTLVLWYQPDFPCHTHFLFCLGPPWRTTHLEGTTSG